MKRTAHGFTLIELIVAIVVIGIAVTWVLMVMNETTEHSADPMIEHQEIAIAEAYLEEILSKSYTSNGQESSRDKYDDVCDYSSGISPTIEDQTGTTVNGLGNYTVTVTVNGGTCGGSTVTLGGIPAEKVDVMVGGPGGSSVTLTGYRTNY